MISCFNLMGAYIYLNKSDIFNHLGRLEEAVQAYNISIRDFHADEILPDDILICGITLFYRLSDKKKYSSYIHKVLDKLDQMYASEFIDACKTVFDCSLEAGDYDIVEKVIAKMDSYMVSHPAENKVGLQIEQVKYTYARQTGNLSAALQALEKKDHYYELIVSSLEDAKDCLDAGMNAHLAKPLQISDVVVAITRCCNPKKRN